MVDFTQLISLLQSPQVIEFVATYAATKGLDSLLKAAKSENTIEYQLVTCLEKALEKTCNEFGLKHDQAVQETFLAHWANTDAADITEPPASAIEKAVGQQVDSEVLAYWTHSFNEAVSSPHFSHLFRYEVLDKFDVIIKALASSISPGASGSEPSTPNATTDIHRYLTLKAPPLNNEFSHRDDMVEELYATINQNKKLALISGLGGIGKTTIAKALYHKVEGEYKYVAWVEYQNSIKDSLLNSFRLFNDVNDSADRYRRIVNFLLGATKDTIIFIDNVSDNDYEGVRFIEQLATNVVLTSRSSKIGNFEAFTVGFLTEEQCVDVFYKYYEYDKARKQKEDARKLVQLVKCHTLSVELLARAANKPGYPLEKYMADLKEKGFGYPTLNVKTNHAANSKTIAEHLKKLFELAAVNDEQKRILKNFALMPSIEIPAEVELWLGCETNDLIGLTKLGWLTTSETGYEMHPIVKEAIQLQYKSVEYDDFEAIIDYMSGKGYISDTDIYTRVRVRLGIAESIMSYVVNIEKDEIGFLFHNIALVYSRYGDYPKALEWNRKALSICEKVLGLEHPATVSTYNNIALVYYSQGDYPKALEWYQKALIINEKVSGLEHPATATSYNNIAGVYSRQGDYPKALEWYRKALIIDEKISGIEQHPATATTYNNIALVYASQGDYPKALKWHLKALEIKEKVLGIEHPSTAITYNNIAGVYDSQGDYSKALEWYQKALSISEKV